LKKETVIITVSFFRIYSQIPHPVPARTTSFETLNMKSPILAEKRFEICLAVVLVTVLLFPLFDLPRPATLTGHPWKVELLSTLFLLLISIVLLLRSAYTEIFPANNKLLFYISVPFILFIVWSGISYFWAGSPRSVAHHTFVWINYLLFLFLAFHYLKKTKSLRLIGYIFSGASFILFLLILSDYLSVGDFSLSEGRIRVRYAKFAELILIAAPLLWAYAFYTKKKLFKNTAFIAGILAWLTPMFSLSKGAFLAGIVGFTVFFAGVFFFSDRKYRRRVLALAGIWLAVTVATQYYFTYSSEIKSSVAYVTGEADESRETSMMRIFTWKVGLQMIRENPLVGVGADNFGLEFNRARRNYAGINPDDPLNSYAEDYYVERSHNELIQIIAELGIVGFLLFAAVFAIPLVYIGKKLSAGRRNLSPIFWGGFAGFTGFFISSMVSSFSFRAVQNGLVFILVLAVMIYELSKTDSEKSSPDFRFLKLSKPIFAVTAIILAFAAANFLTHSLSIYQVYFAERQKDFRPAEKHYDSALFFDAENGSAYLSKGGKLFGDERFAEAVPAFRKAIENGANTVVTYYYLTKCQLLTGDKTAAEQTLREASEIFPNSIYVRTHLGLVLTENGKKTEAENHFKTADKLSPKAAKSWKVVLEKDLLTLALAAEQDRRFQKSTELHPEGIVRAIFFENRKEKKTFQNR
jgi:O-antigen polymerase